MRTLRPAVGGSLHGGADMRCSPAAQESFVLLSAHRHALNELPDQLRRPLAQRKYPGPSLGAALSELGQIGARGVQCDHHLGYTEDPHGPYRGGRPRHRGAAGLPRALVLSPAELPPSHSRMRSRSPWRK